MSHATTGSRFEIGIGLAAMRSQLRNVWCACCPTSLIGLWDVGGAADTASHPAGTTEEAAPAGHADASDPRHHRVTAPTPLVERRTIGALTVHAIQAGG